ncbi:class III lanthipeptide [Nosocomiicoccus sp. HMSC059G07]
MEYILNLQELNTNSSQEEVAFASSNSHSCALCIVKP